MSLEERIREMHEGAVRELIAAHKSRNDEPLVLAVRYGLEQPQDIHLLEVLDGFPGGDDDELLVTSFESSARLRIVGELYLALCSPAQLKAAISRGDAETQKLRGGEVVYDDGSELAKDLKKALGL